MDPFETFDAWFADAVQSEPDAPNAMSLATVSADGRPSLRMVLMKELSARGLVFYTNLGSQKARELLARPFAAACFHWKSLERQVRVEGSVQPVENAEADAYFASRARGSQVGAWASAQSEELPSREVLDARVAEIEARFAGRDVPRPAYWSGFCIVPARIEFWQGRPDRLHDRVRFDRTADGWRTHLLYP